MSAGTDPGHVLRRATIAWGLGHLALGARRTAVALAIGEVAALALVAWLTWLLADTTLYLVPFLAGIGFIGLWAVQAIAAYRSARRVAAAAAADESRSAAIAVGWLSLPLLLWASGFWLLGGTATAPSAAVDRFVRDWTTGELDTTGWPAEVVRAADRATARLERMCADGQLRPSCDATPADRFRDVRVSLVAEARDVAWALIDAVTYERRATAVLGFPTHQLVPVPVERLLRIGLQAQPAALGAVRWRVVEAD